MDHNLMFPKMEQNVPDGERTLSVVVGSLGLMHALSGKKSGKEALIAGFLLFRGATGYCPLYQLLGKEVVAGAVEITAKTSITVNKPISDVFAFWRNLSNLPLFMKHLKAVAESSATDSHWEADLPGVPGSIAWDAKVVSEAADTYIAWKSQPGSQIENEGSVTFKEGGKFGTEIHVVLSYKAPGGKVGEALGKLFNPAFERLIKEDIKNFRKYIETGEIPTYEGQSTGRN